MRLFAKLRTPESEEDFYVKYGPEIADAVSSCFPSTSSGFKHKRSHWATVLKDMQKLGQYSSGNSVEILETGDAAIPRMVSAIDGSKSHVWFESYIVDSSEPARLVIDALIRAAKRGCDVVAILDYCGCLDFNWREELTAAGVTLVNFNPALCSSLSGKSVGPFYFRDHRKILIADETAFCGSMNIHAETAGPEIPGGAATFYDLHLRLRGPCVAQLGEVFRDSLSESAAGVFRPPLPPAAPLPGGVYVQVFQSNVLRSRRNIQLAISRLIDSAEIRLTIASSYFTPPGFLKRKILGAISREIPTHLLVSGDSDFWPLPADLLAQTHAIRKFVAKPGCDVREFSQRHMHAKFFSVDGCFSAAGSFNFDRWSSRRNLEVMVGVMDRKFATDLEISHSRLASVTPRSEIDSWRFQRWWARAACAASYWVVKLTGKNMFDGYDSHQPSWQLRKASLTRTVDASVPLALATSAMWGFH